MNDAGQQFVEMFEKVAIPFLAVAAERREKLSMDTLNNIVILFVTMKQSMGDDMVNQHLAYELDKYRREGLRSDYKE